MSEPDDDHGDVVRRKLGERVVEEFLRHRLGIRHVPHELDRFLVLAYVPELCGWRKLKFTQLEEGRK